MATQGVVFDEVIGEVQPDTPQRPQEQRTESVASAPGPEQIRREIRRLARREARLQAD